MTYTTGSTILASDYNGFANGSSNNIGNVWATGSTDKGWGQSAIANVAAAGTVTATQWATLVNTLTTMGQQTGTTITSRTAPVAGNTISVLANVATDINNLTTNRGFAVAVGTQYTTGGSSTAGAVATNSGGWNLTWTQTVTFASAAAARYFWNAGGRIAITTSKSSTGTDKDPDWNAFAATTGVITLVGRVNGAAQTIVGVSYTGTNKTGGSGTPETLATTTGWYNITPGGSNLIYRQYDAASPYTGDYIAITAAVNAGSTVLTLTTSWRDNGYSLAGENNAISAGAVTALSYYPPSSTYLTTASWGTPTLSSGVA